MSEFNTTLRGRPIRVYIAGATEPHESLEGVEIYFLDTGIELDPDQLSETDYADLQEQVAGEYLAWQIDKAMTLGV